MAAQTKISETAKTTGTPAKVRRADSARGYSSMEDCETAHAAPKASPQAAKVKAAKPRIDAAAFGVQVNDGPNVAAAVDVAIDALHALGLVLPKESPRYKAALACLSVLVGK